MNDGFRLRGDCDRRLFGGSEISGDRSKRSSQRSGGRSTCRISPGSPLAVDSTADERFGRVRPRRRVLRRDPRSRPKASSAKPKLLVEELRDRDLVVEIGVGTGQVALPLREPASRSWGWICRRRCWPSCARRPGDDRRSRSCRQTRRACRSGRRVRRGLPSVGAAPDTPIGGTRSASSCAWSSPAASSSSCSARRARTRRKPRSSGGSQRSRVSRSRRQDFVGALRRVGRGDDAVRRRASDLAVVHRGRARRARRLHRRYRRQPVLVDVEDRGSGALGRVAIDVRRWAEERFGPLQPGPTCGTRSGLARIRSPGWPMSDSVSFDRAAEHYDETRSLTPQASRAVAHLLGGELRQARSMPWKIGVGTGFIRASPARCRGTDGRSRPLRGDVAQAGGEDGRAAGVPVLGGDATRLPFADAVFGERSPATSCT